MNSAHMYLSYIAVVNSQDIEIEVDRDRDTHRENITYLTYSIQFELIPECKILVTRRIKKKK